MMREDKFRTHDELSRAPYGGGESVHHQEYAQNHLACPVSGLRRERLSAIGTIYFVHQIVSHQRPHSKQLPCEDHLRLR
eukprot:SAG31_NODE_3244_length_4500_cov_2.174960_3_plen_79_part_00